MMLNNFCAFLFLVKSDHKQTKGSNVAACKHQHFGGAAI